MAKRSRRAVPSRMRFEVFKRDSFTCQYCGRKAPEVVLHADHIHPASKGGAADLMNLITSCQECNSGKSNVVLDDSTSVSKRMTQAALLQERREQIEMISEWQRGLTDIEVQALSEAIGYVTRLLPGMVLTEIGIAEMRALVAKYGLTDVMSGARVAAAAHVRIDGDGRASRASCGAVLDALATSLRYKKLNEQNPTLASLRCIAGIARNRFPWCPEYHRGFIERAHTVGALPVGTIRSLVLAAYDWGQFESLIERELESIRSQVAS